MGKLLDMTTDIDKRDLRHRRPNPFAGGRAMNPLSTLDEPTLVKVPEAPETHERRVRPRGYLSGTGGPLDNLFGMLDGKQPQAPKKIEVVRTERAPASSDDDDSEPEPGDRPPRYGR